MVVSVSGGATGGSITSELCCKVGLVLYYRLRSTLSFFLRQLYFVQKTRGANNRKLSFAMPLGHVQPLLPRSVT